MEKLLVVWMACQIQRNIPLSLVAIQAKARTLFNTLAEHTADPAQRQIFAASRGWFQRFRKRRKFHSVKISGEGASADAETAAAFKEELDDIITKEGYLVEPAFNVHETSLFWKRMPRHTYIQDSAPAMPGHKANKDRVTLLLSGNAAGFKLKPPLIYHSQNPRSMKHVRKSALPVYYRHNRKAWMTLSLFDDWFQNCFVPETKEYCRRKGIQFNILLLLDSAPAHPRYISDVHPDVKVIYLPPSRTGLSSQWVRAP
ncbi:hypothetical protein M514_02458 [Trichuris suis]|uniref:HTH CENPB-type domain-containing protein n=1 Tax=Trichuris suis TaxID=68888 RepID=A0A085NF77_9BILA|nr:hypothetical protein M514_02458 [Trichuris suis]